MTGIYRLDNEKPHFFNHAYSRLIHHLPVSASGWIDAFFRSAMWTRKKYPLNGQRCRQAIFLELVKRLELLAIVETGTYLGYTSEYFHQISNLPVYSVESNPYYFYSAFYRLHRCKGIHLHLDDSRTFLKTLALQSDYPKKKILFYLDAHWKKDLPLFEELSIIFHSWTESVVIIDDCMVADDQGYGFDLDSFGTPLSLALIEKWSLAHGPGYWPRANSQDETGWRRGCIILPTPDSMSQNLQQLRTLRPIDNSYEQEKYFPEMNKY